MYTVYYKQGCHYCDKAYNYQKMGWRETFITVDMTNDIEEYKKLFLRRSLM